jgi:hypothetical protein
MNYVIIGLLAAMPLNTSGVSEPESSDPIVTFSLGDAWVDFRLEKNGKPVVAARVRILVGSQTWAEGETGETGRGTFPRPDSMYCQVVFDLGKGPSAPVPLTFLADGTVIPTQSPVLSGTSDCCVIPSRRVASPSPDVTLQTSTGTSWRDRVTIGAAVLLVNGTILGWILRRPRHSQNPTERITENKT